MEEGIYNAALLYILYTAEEPGRCGGIAFYKRIMERTIGKITNG